MNSGIPQDATQQVALTNREIDLLGDALMVLLERLGLLRTQMGALRLFDPQIDQTREEALALFRRLNRLEPGGPYAEVRS